MIQSLQIDKLLATSNIIIIKPEDDETACISQVVIRTVPYCI